MADPGPPLTEADLPGILDLLKHCLSHGGVQKQAERGLMALETRQGYCSCMAAIMVAPDADHSARWLASVQLKNSVAKHWQSRYNQRGISADEKAYLRQRLLGLIAQEDNQIAAQVAVTFAKVARQDFPREWPSLLSDLLGQLQGASTLTVRRVYFTLHHVLKELSSKRLAADQRAFAELTVQLFDHAWDQWQADLQTVAAGLPAALSGQMAAGPQLQQLLLHFERWLVLLKIMRRLVLFGFPSDARSLEPVPAVSVVAPAMLQALQMLWVARTEQAPRGQALAMTNRGMVKLVKTLTQMLESHPWSFLRAGMLAPTLVWCCARILAEAAPAPTPASDAVASARDRLLIGCMTFVLGVLQCDAYQGRSGGGLTGPRGGQQAEAVAALAAEAQAALGAFWTAERLAALCQALVGGHFRLTARELQEWEDDAEAFAHARDAGGPQEALRPCAEGLFLALLRAHRDVLSPVVAAMLAAASAACPPGTPTEQLPGGRVGGAYPEPLLAKEAAYNAAAVGAYDLHDVVDYAPWLHGSLLQELTAGGQAARPLRRACACVIGEWVARLRPEDRPPCYAGLVALLGEADVCVQLATVAGLRCLVDDFGFEEAAFTPHAAVAMHHLTAMLCSSSELDTQSQVFGLLNLIIERLGPGVAPYCAGLLQLLPAVWAQAQGQSLLRIQVLCGLQLLTNVMGAASPQAYATLLPLLRHALDPGVGGEPELVEDGLALWLVALRNAPAPHPDLLGLYPLLARIMGTTTEHIGLAMSVSVSAVLLGGRPFLEQHGASLAAALTAYVGGVRERGMLLLLPLMDLVLTGHPGEGAALLAPALQKLLALLLAGSEGSLVSSNALGLFARLLLLNRPAFEALLGACAAAGVQPPASYAGMPNAPLPERLLGAFAELWCDQFDAIAVPLARKLSAAGLAALLPLPSRAVLGLVDVIVSHVAGVWHEVEALGEDGPDGTLYCSPIYAAGRSDEDGLGGASLLASEEAGGEVQRRAAASEAEPLRRLKLSAWLRDALQAAAAAHGPGQLQAVLGALDPAVAAQLQAVLAAAGGSGA